MQTEKTYCDKCNDQAIFTIKGAVPKKENTYYVECEKGHDKEMFISQNLIDALKTSAN